MSTDVTTYQSTLDNDWRYAQAVTSVPERGAVSLLPKAYQGNPANVLIAIGLGTAIGISPAQALYEIYVVNGRPSPSANLMAALVRRAGHKLRINGDARSCTATLIRHDDPDEPFTATWTLEQARAAGLTGKDTWKAYPAAMLRARAIAEVVRMGASEAVIGMDYSAEEMRDVEDAKPATVKATGTDALRAAVTSPHAKRYDQCDDTCTSDCGHCKGAGAPVDAEEVHDDTPPDVTEQRRDTQPAEPITAKTRGHMFALFNELGISEDAQRAGIAHIVGHEVRRRDLTETQGQQIVNRLRIKKAEKDAGAEPVEPGLFEGGGQA